MTASADLWQKATGQTLTIPQQRQLAQGLEAYTPAQVKWALPRYLSDTLVPKYQDFCWWLGEEEVPEDLICRALSSKVPRLISMASELLALEGAWFPQADASAGRIRRTLERALL